MLLGRWRQSRPAGGYAPYASILDPKTGNRKAKLKKASSGLWSRYGNPIVAPDWWLDQLPNCPLDGELWAGRGKFQLCRSICGGDEPDPRFDQIQYRRVTGPCRTPSSKMARSRTRILPPASAGRNSFNGSCRVPTRWVSIRLPAARSLKNSISSATKSAHWLAMALGPFADLATDRRKGAALSLNSISSWNACCRWGPKGRSSVIRLPTGRPSGSSRCSSSSRSRMPKGPSRRLHGRPRDHQRLQASWQDRRI